MSDRIRDGGTGKPRPRLVWGLVIVIGIVAVAAALASSLGRRAPSSAPEPTPSGIAEPATVPEPPPEAVPAAPFAVPAPPEPAPRLADGRDLRTLPSDRLFATAHLAAAQGEYAAAVQLAHWAVAAGGPGQYDLACYYSRVGQVDGALHWLFRAAAEEGVDAEWAAKDSDLDAVRADTRWPQVHAHLRAMSQYWMRAGPKETLLVLPKSYKLPAAIPVVVGMHGMGSTPSDFAGEQFQDLADTLSVAFVGVSGTVALGPRKFRWAESVERDQVRVEDALASIRDRVKIADGAIILIGFSQGAQMSALLAARYPERYAGAIVMSPGTRSHLKLAGLQPSAELMRRRFVVVAGAGEHPSTVATAAADATALRAAHADVFDKVYAEMHTHSFPPDFSTAVPVWIRFILGSGPRP